MSEIKNRISYNPADYKAVENTAESMTKPQLEKYYIEDKNKRHLRCGEIIGIVFLVIFGLVILIGFGMAIGVNIIGNIVSDNILEVSEEICPILGSGYTSNSFFPLSDYTTKIICSNVNSVPG